MTPSFAHATDVGCLREHNEDHYRIDEELGLFVLADGMGGHECGEVASALVTEAVLREVGAGASLSDAIRQAHHDVLAAAEAGQGKAGMGATCLALQLKKNGEYRLAWVGDSRAYRWDGQTLEQLTRDQTYVQMLLDQQAITEEEARNHPDSGVLSQAVGQEHEPVEPEEIQGRLRCGECLLLCSDGLSGELTDEEIAACLSGQHSLQQQVDALVAQARAHGGRDNITVLLVAPDESACKPSSARTQQYPAIDLTAPRRALTDSPPAWKKGAVSALIGVLLFGLVLAAVFYWRARDGAAQRALPGLQPTRTQSIDVTTGTPDGE